MFHTYIHNINFSQGVDIILGFQVAQWVNNPPAIQGTQERRVQSLDWEDLLEEGTATHSCVLAWRIPWTKESGGYSPQDRKELNTTEAIQQGRITTGLAVCVFWFVCVCLNCYVCQISLLPGIMYLFLVTTKLTIHYLQFMLSILIRINLDAYNIENKSNNFPNTGVSS